jgi:hypothetical protein
MSPQMYPYIVKSVESLQRSDPDLVAPMLEVMNAVQSRTLPSALALEATTRAVSNSREGVYDIGTEVLGALADYDQRALQVIATLARSQDARVRHNAIICLTDETPLEAELEVIRITLSDRSSRVRRKAADWASHLHLQQLLPDLRSALIRETHQEAREVVAWAVNALQSP